MAKADDVKAVLTKLTAYVTFQTTEIGSMKQLLSNLGKIIADLNDKIQNADGIPADIADFVAAAQAVDDAVNQNMPEIIKAVTDNTPSQTTRQ